MLAWGSTCACGMHTFWQGLGVLEVAVWNHPDTLLPFSLRWSLSVLPRAADMSSLPVQSAQLSPSSMAGVPGKLPGPLALKEI